MSLIVDRSLSGVALVPRSAEHGSSSSCDVVVESLMRKEDNQLSGQLRQAMVKLIAALANLCANEIEKEHLDEQVMAAMGSVPRHEFVPSELQEIAYKNMPVPIGCGKTISQPFMVALMTDLLEIDTEDKVLEVGTGLGYQAAILAELASKVFTIEIIEELATEAKKRLGKVGYENIEFRVGDGSRGWPENAPYDKIIVTAAPELIPTALLEQLRAGGRMVIPAGTEEIQQLLLAKKDKRGEVTTREIFPVLFSTLIISH